MKIATIIPSIKRENSGWERTKTFLSLNKEIFEDKELFSNLIIYSNLFEPNEFPDYEFIQIESAHNANKLPNYFDFLQLMNYELNCDYVLWLEDQGYLKKEFKEAIKECIHEDMNVMLLSEITDAILIKQTFFPELLRSSKRFSEETNLRYIFCLNKKFEERNTVSWFPSKERNIEMGVAPKDLKKFFY